MRVRCAVHNVRDLGRLCWLPAGLPLQQEDRELCSCPANRTREFLEGKRGPLSKKEHAEEDEAWQREFSALLRK